MFVILRQYALVLWVIVSRPWMLLMLGLGLVYVGPFLGAWLGGRGVSDDAMTPVPVVETPSAFGGFGVAELEEMARGGRLESVADLDTQAVGRQEAWGLMTPIGRGRSDFQLTRTADAGPGAWPLLDRFPSLQRLWMSPPDMLSAEGWRRIGEHTALEVLSLPNVSSTNSVTLEGFPVVARAALERLPRLRELDLRGTGGSFELLLPPLPKIEVLAIGWGRLEENLRTLADGSPRLRVLAIQTWFDIGFTPGMIESLRQMPNLRAVYVAGAYQAEDEPAMTRQVNELRRALPGIRVHPGTYRSSRVWTAFWATILGMYLPFAFWFQSSLLLSTSLAWMLPRRLAPHLFWAMAVTALCGGIMVAVLVSAGVVWVPALTLALFATMLVAGGTLGEVEGIAERISSMVQRVELIVGLAAAATALLAPWIADRWLSGARPWLSVTVLAAVIAATAWKLARQARLPRVLASLGLASPPLLVIDATQGTLPKQPAGSFANWQLNVAERAVDRQISRPVPAPYGEMLRRSQPRIQMLLMVAIMSVFMVGMMWVIPLVIARGTGQPPPPLSQFLPGVIAAFAWQACVMTIAQTTAMWGQRRGSLVIDFLRPVSRAGYWRGLRQAIARDLILPTALGAVCAALALGLSRNVGGWAWCVACVLLVGIFVMTHAMILLLAVTRWPLVVGTLMVVLLVAAGIGAAVAIAHALSISKPADLRTALFAAGAVLVAGLGIRMGVLWRLEEREIG
jgi:hypothetical protein